MSPQFVVEKKTLSYLQMHTQPIPMQTQSFPVHTLVQTHSQATLPIQTQAPQTVMITSGGGRLIQNPVICHQSPTPGFQGENNNEKNVNNNLLSMNS